MYNELSQSTIIGCYRALSLPLKTQMYNELLQRAVIGRSARTLNADM
jgi:hypothetical protein